eukprot:1137024-Pelagomonas_calceolata.AAC.1
MTTASLHAQYACGHPVYLRPACTPACAPVAPAASVSLQILPAVLMLMPMGVAAMVAAAAGAPQWLAAVPAGQRPARLCMSSTFAITVILVVVIIRIVLGHRKGDAAAQWHPWPETNTEGRGIQQQQHAWGKHKKTPVDGVRTAALSDN